jgi:hypothetical protein
MLEGFMATRLQVLAIAAVLAAGLSSAAFARYPCRYGYALYHHHCRLIAAPGYSSYSNPVSGAVSGAQSGAANGYAAGGPVGAAVGTALGTASGTLTGTANMLTGR